jgi:hypothetical protein
MEDSGSFQAGWNLAEPMLIDIANRLRSGRDCFLRGDLERYYWNMETIVRMIYGFLTADEIKTSSDKEKEIQKFLPIRERSDPKLPALLKEYDGIVMILLHHHKFLMPPKKDKTRLIG